VAQLAVGVRCRNAPNLSISFGEVQKPAASLTRRRSPPTSKRQFGGALGQALADAALALMAAMSLDVTPAFTQRRELASPGSRHTAKELAFAVTRGAWPEWPAAIANAESLLLLASRRAT